MIEVLKTRQKLIFAVVKKGKASRVIRAIRKAGGEGATIIPGKGMSIHKEHSFLGVPIEDEKECVMTIVPEENKDAVMSKIRAAVRLDRRGNGIAFVLNPTIVTGVAHLINHNKKASS
jgi:nitrogen regulatory protein P-II 1